MTKDEALKLALEALQQIAHVSATDYEYQQWAVEAITAIKEALAQPEQEPVALADNGVVNWIADKQFQHEALLYSAPQRTWVGLTEKDICEAAVKSQDGISPRNDTLRFAIAIEAKLKEKNS